MTTDSQVAREYWRHRHTTFDEDPRAWCIHYWESWTNAYRWTLAEAVATFAPRRVLELGCNVGPNLHVLRKALGVEVPLIGVDLNRAAVAFGQERFASLGDAQTQLVAGEFLTGMRGWGADVICSCYALSYLAPGDEIRDVVRAAWTEAERGLVFAEPTTLGLPTLTDPAIEEWAHNYGRLFHEIGVPTGAITYRTLDVPGTHLNGLWIARKETR